MSIVEAFSVGTPVICSDLGNAGSVVEEGITGYKFTADLVDEIIQAVKRCHGLCSQTKKVYKDKIVVNDVNIHVKKGDIYGFVGPNGAGKSTLMKMLLNLVQANSGEIVIRQ
mgnify:CR=1 FL=1